MGDHIFLSCNGSPNDEHQVDVLFLVSWKVGNGDIGVCPFRLFISTNQLWDIIATRDSTTSNDLRGGIHTDLGKAPRICSHGRKCHFPLRLCRRTRSDQIYQSVGAPPALRRRPTALRTLPLRTESHLPPRPYATDSSRLPPRFPFRYNPADGIACFVLGVGLEEIPGASMTIAIVVHHSALVALASAGAAAAAGAGAGDAAPATCNQFRGTAGAHPSRDVSRSHTGADAAGPSGSAGVVLAHDRLVMHDFNPHSVRRAVAQLSHATHVGAAAVAAPPGPGPSASAGAGAGGMLLLRHENGNRTRVVTAPTRLTAGLCFRGDVMSHLPYVETRATCAPRRWESMLTDGKRLFGLYFKVRLFLFSYPTPIPSPSLQGSKQGIVQQHRLISSHPRPFLPTTFIAGR
jgi:hypothetical protein